MKIFSLIFAWIFSLFLTLDLFAQFNEPLKSNLHVVNEWSNGGGEYGKVNWVNWSETGSGTLSTDTSTKLRGKASIKFVSAGSGDYVSSSGVSCKQGPNCLVRFWYKTTGTSWTAYIYDGSSNLVQTLTLPANTDFTKAELSFVASSSTTLYSLRITDGSAGADTLYLDEGYLGMNDNVGSVAQSEFVGSVTFTNSSCQWTVLGGGTYTNFGTASGCTYNTTGNVSAVLGSGNPYPAVTINSPKKGNYYFVFVGYAQATIYGAYYRFSDGTNNSEVNFLYSGSDPGSRPQLVGNINYTTTPSSPLTVHIQARGNTANQALYANTNDAPARISVYYFPSQSEQVVRAENANGFGYAKWYNVTNCVFTESSGSYTTLTDADCNAATESFGVTSGNDNLEITKSNLKADTYYKITASGAFYNQYATSAGRCDYRIYDGTNEIITSFQTVDSGVDSSVMPALVGYVKYSSPQASKTFSVQAKKSIGGGSCNCDASSSTGPYSCMLSIEEVYPTQAMPQIINSVGTTYNGQTILNSAKISDGGNSKCSSSPCGVIQETGNWIDTTTRSGTGSYTINLVSGVFPTIPSCTTTSLYYGTSVAQCLVTSASTSSLGISCLNSAGSGVDEGFNIICHATK
jgi:hypothetical protein